MARFPAVGDDFGPFRITGTLGRGGMGVVFEAEDSRLGRTVALKVLTPLLSDDPAFRERFAQEAGVLAQLDSLHIVQIFEHGEQDGCLFLAAQLIRDGDLGTRLQMHGPLPAKLAVSVVGQLCEALADAHEAGLVHRNIKPSNVLVRERGSVLYAYLCDFGIAAAGSTATGSMTHLAPELHDGAQADVRSDVYSIGCLLWVALTGSPPYDGTDVQVAMSHLRDPISQLGGDDVGTVRLNEILARAMAKDPGDRYQGAAELGAALAALTTMPAPAQVVPSVAAPAPVLVEEYAEDDTFDRPGPLADSLLVDPDPPVLDLDLAVAAPLVLPPEPVEGPPLEFSRPLFVDDLEEPEPEVDLEDEEDDEPEGEQDDDVVVVRVKRSRRRKPREPREPREPRKLDLDLDLGWLTAALLYGVLPVAAIVGALILVKGNTSSVTSDPVTVTESESFSIGEFVVGSGWTVTVGKIGTAADTPATLSVSGVKVSNTSTESASAAFTLTFVKNDKVIAEVECTSGEVGADLQQEAECAPAPWGANLTDWDEINVQEIPE